MPKTLNNNDLLAEHVPYSIMRCSPGESRLFWELGEGAHINCDDGNKYIDITSAFGVSILGHANPKISEAISQQAIKLPHAMGEIYSSSLYGELARTILETLQLIGAYQVAFTQGGSEAIDLALKLVRMNWPKAKLFAFAPGFHGQLMGALSVTGMSDLRQPLIDDDSNPVGFLPFPETQQDVRIARGHLDRAFSNASDGQPVVLVMEAMGNANGLRVVNPMMWEYINEQRAAGRLKVVIDEIYTGFGRSGRWLLHQDFTPTADIICIGKAFTGGLPLGGCLAPKEIWERLDAPTPIPLHGTTFAGNPVCLAAALAAVRELRTQEVLSRAGHLGEMITKTLQSIQLTYPDLVRVRGVGLMHCIEFLPRDAVGAKIAGQVVAYLKNAGILALQTALPIGNAVGISPPMVISDTDMALVLRTFEKAIFAALSS